MQRIAVYGATGSIGASALDVIARHPDRMRASVLAAGTRVDALLALCRVHRPAHAVIADAGAYAALRDGLRDAGLETEAHAGAEALDSLVAGDACDSVVAAIVGAAGLSSTLAAARAGKRLLLANKESLVLAGELLMQAAQAHGATIVPIDSEHNAIFQCLAGNPGEVPARITLTASGGPFRGWTRDALATVTPAQAVAHPKWSMGLGWPRRIASGVPALDLLAEGGRLDFAPPDLDAFPCLALAFRALQAGGAAPAVLNAANEEAVSAFLQGRIGFLSIPDVVAHALDAMPATPADSIDALLAADAWARSQSSARIALKAA